MAQIKILAQGYAHKKGGAQYASPSAVLIQEKRKNILVDPGSNQKLLLDALEKLNLAPKDMHAIFITHWHPDHILNIRLFPDVDIFDVDEMFHNDEIREHNGNILNTSIKIIPTEGHARGHASLLVETGHGKIAISGDIFWWEDDEDQKTDYQGLIAHVDPYVKNRKALIQSRKKLLKLADFIIPGHGKMFAVEK